MATDDTQEHRDAAGPIGWLLKLLVLIGKFLYYFIRILLWILRRLRPRKN